MGRRPAAFWVSAVSGSAHARSRYTSLQQGVSRGSTKFIACNVENNLSTYASLFGHAAPTKSSSMSNIKQKLAEEIYAKVPAKINWAIPEHAISLLNAIDAGAAAGFTRQDFQRPYSLLGKRQARHGVKKGYLKIVLFEQRMDRACPKASG